MPPYLVPFLKTGLAWLGLTPSRPIAPCSFKIYASKTLKVH
jgi:hypothetical protein